MKLTELLSVSTTAVSLATALGGGLVGLTWFVFAIRADVDEATNVNGEQDQRIERQEAQDAKQDEILEALKRLHEKENERIEAQKELMRSLCRQKKLDRDTCAAEGYEVPK